MTWVTVEVDVDISEFSDEDIEAEYNERNLGTSNNQGRRDEAYAILWDMCLDKVNKIV